MSTASDMGGTTAQPTSADIVNAGIAQGGGWFGGVGSVAGKIAGSVLNSPLIGNFALVAVGVILAVGALLVSQKETTIKIAKTVAG